MVRNAEVSELDCRAVIGGCLVGDVGYAFGAKSPGEYFRIVFFAQPADKLIVPSGKPPICFA